jgi:hypothetical protein
MNAKQLFAVSALVLGGASAFAVEGEQWIPPTGSLTRAEVKAELARAQAAGEIVTHAAYGGFESTRSVAARAADIATAARSRNEVRTEARASIRANTFGSLYVGG